MTWLALWKAIKAVPAWAWALLAFAVLVLGAYWYGGHNQRQEDKAEMQQLRDQLGQCARSLRKQNEANQQAIANAERAKADAIAAEKHAGDYAEKFASQIVSINRSLAEAKKDPACRQLLETRSCARLY
jgi:uncharacterized protein HemX